jgi:hypothetical protein
MLLQTCKRHTSRLCATAHVFRLALEFGKEHEVYFLEGIRNNKLLPLFQKWFGWGDDESFNNINLDHKYPVEESGVYCKTQETTRQLEELSLKTYIIEDQPVK